MAFGVATKYRNSFWYLWSWELSGLTLSMGCMLAIIIILFHMNNRPLSAWDLPISLNTAISVFSALSQTSMMLSVAEGISQLKWIYFQQREHPLIHLQTFDEASRGPWGAMMFIWKIRWHALVASVGAVITILALAMQSFTQQTIKLPSRQVLTTDVRASVHASRSFDTGRPYLPLDNPAVALLDLTPVPVGGFSHTGTNNAIYRGLYAPDTQMQYSCPTNNCTWHFEALGVCSKCSNVSSSLQTTCRFTNTTPPIPPFSFLPLGRPQYCNYTTPSGLQSSASICVNNLNMSTILNSSVRITTHPWKPLLSFAFFRSEAKEAKIRSALEGTNVTCQLPKPVAYECQLHWCAKSYRSTFSGGVFMDKPVHSEPLLFGPQTLYTDSLNNNGTAAACSQPCYPQPPISEFTNEATVYSIPGFKAADVPQNWTATNASSLQSSNKAFWINAADALDIQKVFQNVLTADLTSSMTSETNVFLSERLYELISGNVSAAMDAVATSLTNAIRAGPNSTIVSGTAYTEEVYVHVEWPWLIFPIAVVLLAAIFLATSMVFSREKSKIGWKSAILPLLFHGLNGWADDALAKRNTRHMEEADKGMFALLEDRGQDRLGLVKP